MPFASGVVNNHAQAYNRILASGWPVVWQNGGSDAVIAGAGRAGRKVYLGVRFIEIDATATYGMQLFGMSGINLNVQRLEDHINVSPGKYMFLNNAPMNFWVTVDDYRMIATFQVSGKFFLFYAGLVLPPADPMQNPYPYLLGAPAGVMKEGLNSWRSEDIGHSLLNAPTSGLGYTSGTCFLDPTGVWRPVVSRPTFGYQNELMMGPDGPGLPGVEDAFGVSPDRGNTVRSMRDRIGLTLDGGTVIRPLAIIDPVSDSVYGQLNGLHQIPGRNIASPDIETVDGVDHLVVQNVFRTGFGDVLAQQLS